MSFYDGSKLLSMKDLSGEKPEIYICTSNRSAGKTTWFTKYVVNQYIKKDKKFAFLYRFKYELDDCADKIFKDVQTLFFPDHFLKSEKRADGVYHELYLNDASCGYVLCLNSADQIKKLSHFFSDISCMIFDEFQSETNTYCSNEISKFQSIHTSIARGQKKQVRYVPVYMISNPITLLNPYYIAMGISDRIRTNTKFLKGNGYVLEQGFNESAAKLQESSGFNRAFAKTQYTAYAAQGIYLNDNQAFIDSPTGKGRYLATLRYNGIDFGVREFAAEGIIYVDKKPDHTYKLKIAVTKEDHTINYILIKQNEFFLSVLRDYFNQGCFRFKDLQCKDALIKAISY